MENLLPLNDNELTALTALVNSENILMQAENEQRSNQGYAPAYTMSNFGSSPNAERLILELKRRKIIE